MTPTLRPFVLAFLVAPLLACGAGGGDESAADDATASAADEATDTRTDPEGPAWTVMVQEGGEDVVDLPDIRGEELDGVTIGSTFQVKGMHPDRSLLIRMTTTGEWALGDYEPLQFEVAWSDLGYTCVAGSNDFMVTLASVEPLEGSYEGRVGCYADDDSGNRFETRITGEFAETM